MTSNSSQQPIAKCAPNKSFNSWLDLHFINQHLKKTKRKPLSHINNFVEVGPLLKNTSNVEKQQGTLLDMKVISLPTSPSLLQLLA
jgi:hypothetical protein